ESSRHGASTTDCGTNLRHAAAEGACAAGPPLPGTPLPRERLPAKAHEASDADARRSGARNHPRVRIGMRPTGSAMMLAAAFPARSQLLKKRRRVKDVRPGLIQPSANRFGVNLVGAAELSLCRIVFADGFQGRLVQRLAVPEQEADRFW